MRLNPHDLRQTLHRHAADVGPEQLDPFDGLQARVRRVRRQRRLATTASGVTVLAVILAGPLLRRTATPPEPAPDATPGPPAAAPAVPVYYLHGDRLAREFRALGMVQDPVAAAVNTMLRRPALDPDYHSGWPRSATAEVRPAGAGFLVDVSAPPVAGCLAVQQLVYTVTAAARSSGPVVVLVGGRPAADRPGLATCVPGAGVPRDAALRVAVQVSSPNHGDTVGPSFLLTGFCRVADGTLRWQVRDARSRVVLANGAPVGDVNRIDGWSIRVDLPAAALGRDVELEVSGTPAAGSAVGTDTKLLHVTA